MRVLHIDSERGWRGGQQQAFSLMSGLAARGCVQVLGTPEGSELGRRAGAAGIEVAEYRGLGWWDPRAGRVLRAAADRTGARIVHAHSANAHAIAHRVFGDTHPIVVTRRVDFAIRRNPFSLARYRHGGTHYIAISSAIRGMLLEAGVRPERIALVPSGIDPGRASGGRREALRGEFLGGREGPVVGFVGALVGHKDPMLLARAGVLLEGRLPGLRVVFVGAGEVAESPEWGFAVRGRRGLFLEAGWRQDIADVFAALDLFVMPSREEGLCTSLLDAQAAGVPCVVTAAGGMVDIVRDGENGLLVPVGDAGALARAIERLWRDGEARTRFAARGREVVRERFTVEAMVEGNLEVYRGIAGPAPLG